MVLLRHILLVICLVFVSGLQEVSAQQQAPDYEQWARIALRAEEAIENGRASETAMDALRAQLVEWRSKFETFESSTNISIETLEARLDSLGPPPGENDTEPDQIKNERDELESRLAQARVPIVKAGLAKTEAEKLVEGIDRLMRERHASELLKRGPSPLNIANWRPAFTAMATSTRHVFSEISTAWAYEKNADEFAQNTLNFLVLFAVAGMLLARGTNWTARAIDLIRRDGMSAGRELAVFFVSTGFVILPLIGVYVLVEALYATDLAGLRGDRVLHILPFAAFLYLMPAWIGRRIFSRSPRSGGRLQLSDAQLKEAQRWSYWVGAVMALYQIFAAVSGFDGWGSEARSIVLFPLIIAACALMLRFAHLFRMNVRINVDQADGEAKYYDHFLNVLARFYQFAAIIGAALAMAGYARASEALVFPAIYTVQLIAFLILLNRLFNHLFHVASGSDENTERGLWPLVLSAATIVASTPLFLLSWGMRPTEISSLYQQLLSGFRVGEIIISPSEVIIFIAVFSIGFILTRVLQAFLKNTFLPRTKLDIGGQNAIVAGVGYVGITVSAMVALNNTGIDLGSIALVASALSVGIGFGLQTIVSNFVSGIILLIERPIAEGDWIEVNGQMGYVRDISVRSTRIETFDRTDVIVPNGDLVAGTVTNFTRGNTVGRVIVPVGVAYGTDPRLVEKILLDVANAHPMVLATPPPYIVFQGFGASSLDFEIRAILRDVNWVLSVRSDMNYDIAKRFVDAGIEIPFPQQDVWVRNPEEVSHAIQIEPVSEEELRRSQGPRDGEGVGEGDSY